MASGIKAAGWAEAGEDAPTLPVARASADAAAIRVLLMILMVMSASDTKLFRQEPRLPEQ
jgi:hypothetical protein